MDTATFSPIPTENVEPNHQEEEDQHHYGEQGRVSSSSSSTTSTTIPEVTKLIGIRDNNKKETWSSLFFVIFTPLRWFQMLANSVHWSFVIGVVVVYGMSQGVGGSLFRVASDYYWKDVQMIQPSEAQIFSGIINIPWIVKPLWGILTDVLPIAGYRRRPYFILSGLLGVIPMLILAVGRDMDVSLALILMTAGSAGVAIADVTIDACVAENSINLPVLAADLQSLCGFSSSVGRLLGFSISGFLVHKIGSQGVLGLLSLTAGMVFVVGIILKENPMVDFSYGQINQKIHEASEKMATTVKCREVWRPCVYMFISLALSLNIHEGLFFWYTDPNAGPNFSERAVGFIFSIGALGSLCGVLLYQNILKDYSFHTLLFWSQLLFGFSGMLDLILVLRVNLKFNIPDYFFVAVDECVGQMIGRIKWLPLLVLSSRLCPSGIEGTFYALLMSIDNAGLLASSWLGGLLMKLLNVTRTKFTNLWLAILVRNLMRLLPLALLHMLPENHHQNLHTINNMDDDDESRRNVELVSLVGGDHADQSQIVHAQ